MGHAFKGAASYGIARQDAFKAGLSDADPGMAINRQCTSGLMSISIAAEQIMHDGMNIAVGGGVEAGSLAQNKYANIYSAHKEWLVEHKPLHCMGMLETAEIVAEQYSYSISRTQQDTYARQAAATVLGKPSPGQWRYLQQDERS